MTPLEIIVWDRTKREVQAQFLQISQAEAHGFWSTYEEYEHERRRLLRERWKLVDDYSKAVDSNNDQARVNKITMRLLWNGVYQKRSYEEYYREVNLIIGTRRAIKFIAIERYFESRMNAKLDSMMVPETTTVAMMAELIDDP